MNIRFLFVSSGVPSAGLAQGHRVKEVSQQQRTWAKELSQVTWCSFINILVLLVLPRPCILVMDSLKLSYHENVCRLLREWVSALEHSTQQHRHYYYHHILLWLRMFSFILYVLIGSHCVHMRVTLLAARLEIMFVFYPQCFYLCHWVTMEC